MNMKRLFGVAVIFVSLALALSGCSLFEFGVVQRAAWRHQAEAQCMASGSVRATAYITPLPEIDGRGGCGADHPFKIHAFSNGAVQLSETAELNCPTAAAMEDWLTRVVQPTAQEIYGQQVVGLKLLGTYNCRSIARTSYMSEHSYMNAVDVGGFRFADGHDIVIARDWNSQDPTVRQFLRTVGDRSCLIFNTVLGPDYNSDHYNHFHLDLAARFRTHKRVCKGGGLKDPGGPRSLPVFTSSIKPKTPPFGTGEEQPMPPPITSGTGSMSPLPPTVSGYASQTDYEGEMEDDH